MIDRSRNPARLAPKSVASDRALAGTWRAGAKSARAHFSARHEIVRHEIPETAAAKFVEILNRAEVVQLVFFAILLMAVGAFFAPVLYQILNSETLTNLAPKGKI